ncbi:putative RNA recognition motif domain, nucleotide-binding alpha-beta plait domain superfamily [Helianthus annuus]|nr:putative RNA recognition motif domain, nucleotide-binding alpha-beta plait domain superfamily [Helianthus annuus]
MERDILKLFVSNIPGGCRPWDLASSFKSFGDIAGVYIARKRDKEGLRFGFVSFKGVRNKEDLLSNLKGIRIGNFKLKVNIARFVEENGAVDQERPQAKKKQFHAGAATIFQAQVPEGRRGPGGDTYADALMNNKNGMSIADVIEVDPSMCALAGCRGIAFIGRTINFKVLRTLKLLIWRSGYLGAEIQYVGGFYVLVSFINTEEAEEFLRNKEVWGYWFSMLEYWNGQALPFERIAWIKIQGVPLHLFNNVVFDSIGKKFGTLIQPSQVQEDDGDLSVVCIGILRGDGKKIEGEVSLHWQDKKV